MEQRDDPEEPLLDAEALRKRQHAIHQAFRKRYETFRKGDPDNEFCKHYMMQTTRVGKNKLIDLWDQLGRDFEKVVTHVHMVDERSQEDSRGSKGRYVQAEQLVATYGQAKTDIYIANCKRLLPRYPELVSFDPLFESETYLLSENVIKTMTKERLMVKFVTEPRKRDRQIDTGCVFPDSQLFPQPLADAASAPSSVAEEPEPDEGLATADTHTNADGSDTEAGPAKARMQICNSVVVVVAVVALRSGVVSFVIRAGATHAPWPDQADPAPQVGRVFGRSSAGRDRRVLGRRRVQAPPHRAAVSCE
jgi:hypothetical protein